jgi:hypothetical protein
MELITEDSPSCRRSWRAHRLRSSLSAAGRRWCASTCAALALLEAGGGAAAQVPSNPPYTAADGRLAISGQVSAAAAPSDPGYFDYSGYDHNLLQLVQFDAAASFRVNPRLFLVADLRVEGSSAGGAWHLRPYTAFVRVRPWPRRSFDVQAGLIPPVFGAFSRRAYSRDNPLIGIPLAYEYLTSLRHDAVPASADELLAMRGRGWRPSYSEGYTGTGYGLPLIDGVHNQLGLEVHAAEGKPIEVSAAVTSGSLSVPTGRYAQVARQVSARIAARPVMGLVLGLSGSRGVFLDRSIIDEYGGPSPGIQSAVGFDAELSGGHWLVRTEGVVSRWTLPPIEAPFITSPLGAFGMSVEGRYRLRPGLDVAARFDHLGFSEISGTSATLPWDAPVRRVEIGFAYSPLRRLTTKVAWQENWRDTSFHPREGLLAVQVIAWF